MIQRGAGTSCAVYNIDRAIAEDTEDNFDEQTFELSVVS